MRRSNSIKLLQLAVFITYFALIKSSNFDIKCNVQQMEFNNTKDIRTCKLIVTETYSNKSTSLLPDLDTECRGLFAKNSNLTMINFFISDYLPHLEYFIYEDSKLVEINSDTLTNLTDLLEISFHKNLLSTVNSGTFKDSKKLRKISLDANRIKSIDFDVFEGLTHLREIYLNDNEIVKLDSRIFMHNPDIFVINLEMNRIEFLPVSVFHGLEKLSVLKLDFNKIKEIPNRIFMENKELQVLTISYNHIDKIGSKNIDIFGNLKEINLYNNDCTEDLATGYDLDELKEIIQEKCKDECDDRERWLEQELSEHKRSKRNVQNNLNIEELQKNIINIVSEMINERISSVNKTSAVESNFEDFVTKSHFESFVKNKSTEFGIINDKINDTLVKLENINANIIKIKQNSNKIENIEEELQKISGKISNNTEDLKSTLEQKINETAQNLNRTKDDLKEKLYNITSNMNELNATVQAISIQNIKPDENNSKNTFAVEKPQGHSTTDLPVTEDNLENDTETISTPGQEEETWNI